VLITLTLTTIIAAVVFLRGQNLSSPLYYDEAVYVNLAQHPFHSDFYDDPIFFRHPPAHYLLLAGVGKLAGFSETAMRLPSLLLAGATAFLIYLLGLQLFSRGTGFIAALLFTLNVLQQQYAEAATMYALLAFAMTLCCYGFARGQEWLVAAGFLSAIYTHYFGFYLAPALLLFYYRKLDGDWKKIAGRIALYVLAYAPWLIIAAQGLAFHAKRTSGLRWWDFHALHAIRQMSLPLFGALLAFLYAHRRDRRLQPLVLTCALYLLSAFFLIPFHRYLVPFLPIFFLLSVAALAQLASCLSLKIKTRAVLLLACAGALFFPNPQAYGFFPQQGAHLDLRDSIHAQEWDKVVATIPDSAKVATPNARSLLFYSNLAGLRHYEVEQFNENQKEFAKLLERATNESIVLTKYPLYSPLLNLAEHSASYALVAEFEHTVLYQKRPKP
jgi:4-amino-4-deoxy-L-arabinose transferase-like glycosyltransferase